MIKHPLLFMVCFAAALPCAAQVAAAPAESSVRPPNAQWVPASDTRFSYDGRFDFSNPSLPVAVWEASTISIDFDGGTLGVRFTGATGTNFFDATVDGKPTVLSVQEGAPAAARAVPVSGTSRHHLVIFKRTEASAGTARFAGIEIEPRARVFSPVPPVYRLKMVILGDSITAGACALDGASDQWADRSTHDAAYSWAAVTAGAFSADYQNISVSGIGLAAGYDDVLMGQVWDRLYPSATAPKADLSLFVPDVVLVLLGDNDDSYPREHHLPFPGNFGENYIALIHAVRTAYPRSEIVLLNGGMWAGIHSKELLVGWGNAVAALEATDPRITHFTFAHWTNNHPRVADHQALGDELDSWLKPQPFMAGPAQ